MICDQADHEKMVKKKERGKKNKNGTRKKNYWYCFHDMCTVVSVHVVSSQYTVT